MTKNEQQRRDHALHNEQTCLYLHQTGDYPDWVVTTAFYAALHFARYKIFPLQKDGETYQDFDDYLYSNDDGSKHTSLQRLVRAHQHLKKISSEYRFLFDKCQNSRYYDYQVPPSDVVKVLEYLERIKRVCNTNKQ